MDTHAEIAVGQRLAGYSVIDVLTSRRVHGADAEATQVLPALHVLRPRRPICRRQAPEYSLSELACDHSVLVENDRALHCPVPYIAEDLRPVPAGVVAEAVPAIQHDDNTLVFEVAGMPRLDLHVGQPCVAGDEDAVRLVVTCRPCIRQSLVAQRFQSTTVLPPVALDDAHNLPLRALARDGCGSGHLPGVLDDRITRRRRFPGRTELGVVHLELQPLCGLLSCALLCGVNLLHHHNILVNGPVQRQAPGDLQLSVTAEDGPMDAGAHVHLQRPL
mmetsp:Transcript_12/g.52  ORF Transcript_12/g.52 Transcript_12/m.52 type:complete len:275 (-) Transcript_12:5-829(-)